MITNAQRRPDRTDGGFTLVELLVAMVISSILLGVLCSALILLLRQPPETIEHLSASDSAFRTSSLFGDDIASATAGPNELAITRNAAGCGGDTNSVLRVLTKTETAVEIRSYSISDNGRALERRTCHGTTEAAALTAPVDLTRSVVTNLDPGSRPAVACRTSATAAPAPETAEGDAQCRLVTMTVKTHGSLTFAVDGRRETVQTPLTPPPPPRRTCTLIPAGDTNINTDNRSATAGDQHVIRVQAKQSFSRKNAYIRFDLLGGCQGEKEPGSLPGAKTVKSATLTLTVLRKDGANIGPNGNTKFRLVTLPDWYTWHEDTLTYNDLKSCLVKPTVQEPNPLAFPCEFPGPGEQDPGTNGSGDPDFFYNFRLDPSVPIYGTVDIPVTRAVQRWYDGRAINRGWSLDRGYYFQNDSDGTGWAFASREYPLPEFRPKLTIEWQ